MTLFQNILLTLVTLEPLENDQRESPTSGLGNHTGGKDKGREGCLPNAEGAVPQKRENKGRGLSFQPVGSYRNAILSETCK